MEMNVGSMKEERGTLSTEEVRKIEMRETP